MTKKSNVLGKRGGSDPIGRRSSSAKRGRNSGKMSSASAKKYRIKVDEKDLEQLLEPFVSQKLTFKCYLYTRDGSLYNKSDRPKVSVSLYYADDTISQTKKGNHKISGHLQSTFGTMLAGKALDKNYLTVEGNNINEEGEAKITLMVHKLSKEVRNKQFCLRFKMVGDEFKDIPHIMSQPFKTYNYKIRVLKEVDSVFYKDEGGRDKSMLMKAELHSVTGIETSKEVPLILTLHYHDEEKTQLNDEAQKHLRVMEEQADLKITKGKVDINFRINDVSKNHQKLPFCVKIAPKNVPSYKDVAFAFTSGVKVLSKRNKTKKNPAALVKDLDHSLGNGLSAESPFDSNQTLGQSIASNYSKSSAAVVPSSVRNPYRLNIAPDIKRKIHREEDVPFSNCVGVITQYAAYTTMWMEEVNKRNKQFQNDWNNVVYPCITQLLKHAKEQEISGNSTSGETQGISRKSHKNRKPTQQNAAGVDGLDPSPASLAPTSSLVPMNSVDIIPRGTSYEIAKLFDSIDPDNTLLPSMDRLQSLGRYPSMGMDYFNDSPQSSSSIDARHHSANKKSLAQNLIEKIKCVLAKEFVSSKKINVGHASFSADTSLLGFHKKMRGKWMFTPRDMLTGNNSISQRECKSLIAKANKRTNVYTLSDSLDLDDVLAKL